MRNTNKDIVLEKASAIIDKNQTKEYEYIQEKTLIISHFIEHHLEDVVANLLALEKTKGISLDKCHSITENAIQMDSDYCYYHYRTDIRKLVCDEMREYGFYLSKRDVLENSKFKYYIYTYILSDFIAFKIALFIALIIVIVYSVLKPYIHGY